MAEAEDAGGDGFTAYADAESSRQGLDLLGEFNTIVDRANTELAEALKGYLAAGTYEERLLALQFMLRVLASIAYKAGIHGENLIPISNLLLTMCETPSPAWDALGFKMWGELKAAKEVPDVEGRQEGSGQDRALEKKIGGQERRPLRIDFLDNEAACHDYLIANGVSQPDARRFVAETCDHRDMHGDLDSTRVKKNVDDAEGKELRKFRPLYNRSLARLNHMPGSPKENVERVLRFTLLHTPPNMINRDLGKSDKRKEVSEARAEAKKERDKAAKKEERRMAKANS